MSAEFVPRQRPQTTRAGCGSAAFGAIATTGEATSADGAGAGGAGAATLIGDPQAAQKRLVAVFRWLQFSHTYSPAGCAPVRGEKLKFGAGGLGRTEGRFGGGSAGSGGTGPGGGGVYAACGAGFGAGGGGAYAG